MYMKAQTSKWQQFEHPAAQQAARQADRAQPRAAAGGVNEPAGYVLLFWLFWTTDCCSNPLLLPIKPLRWLIM